MLVINRFFWIGLGLLAMPIEVFGQQQKQDCERQEPKDAFCVGYLRGFDEGLMAGWLANPPSTGGAGALAPTVPGTFEDLIRQWVEGDAGGVGEVGQGAPVIVDQKAIEQLMREFEIDGSGLER